MNTSSKSSQKRICLGAFAGAHGVRGDIRIKAFTNDPADVAAYGAITTENGNHFFELKIIRILKNHMVVARTPEIRNREAAQALTGTRFYTERATLSPTDEDEFYIEDLIDLSAISSSGQPMGRVKAVHNFGAGDIIELYEIPDVKGVHMVPFTKFAVPHIDLTNSAITIHDDFAPERRPADTKPPTKKGSQNGRSDDQT